MAIKEIGITTKIVFLPDERHDFNEYPPTLFCCIACDIMDYGKKCHHE